MSGTQTIGLQLLDVKAPQQKSQTPVREIANWDSLERQDWHLWLLSMLLILVLGVSLLGFMFPAVFWADNDSQTSVAQRAFYGFSALLGLVLVYLLQRQAAIRQLKRQLRVVHAALDAAERQATAEVFVSLPDMGQFRDTLAMEYRRASSTGTALAGLMVKVSRATPENLGKLAKKMRAVLRQGESMYRISDTAFGIILPNMHVKEVRFFASKVEELGSEAECTVDSTTVSFPDEVSSLAEFETRLKRI